jgi:hypothetical protein
MKHITGRLSQYIALRKRLGSFGPSGCQHSVGLFFIAYKCSLENEIRDWLCNADADPRGEQKRVGDCAPVTVSLIHNLGGRLLLPTVLLVLYRTK